MYPTEDLTGMIDPNGTGSYILKDRVPDGGTVEVTLPTMECANCTLQLIQVMTNAAPYTTDALSDDIYFNCADLVLAANAPDAGVFVTADGGDDPGGGGGVNRGTETGGCSAGGSGGGWLAAFAVAGFAIRRRRRS